MVESYRNVLDEVSQRTLLSVGFMNELTSDQIDQGSGRTEQADERTIAIVQR